MESFPIKLRFTSNFVLFFFAYFQEMLLKRSILDIYSILLIIRGFIMLNIMCTACWMLVAIVLNRKKVLNLLIHSRLSSRLFNLLQIILLIVLMLFLWRHFLSLSMITFFILMLKSLSYAFIHFHIIRDFANFRYLFFLNLFSFCQDYFW